jgi:hypothetical protein
MGNEFAYDMMWTVISQDGPSGSDGPTVGPISCIGSTGLWLSTMQDDAQF